MMEIDDRKRQLEEILARRHTATENQTANDAHVTMASTSDDPTSSPRDAIDISPVLFTN